jgi:hypothetical protein
MTVVATLVLLGSSALMPVLAAPVLAAPIRPAVHVPETDVHGDDAGDRYVGTGGVLLPHTVATPIRYRVAGCDDCQWRMASPCVAAVGLGTPFPGQATCQSVVRGCPGMAEHLRVWFRPAGGEWQDVGLVCLARGGPVTMTHLRRETRARFVADLPSLNVEFAPPAGVLTQLPVVFDSAQSGDGVAAQYQILGQAVQLRAVASWTWTFGDGAVLDTTRPGGRYPDLSVSHTYRQAGRYLVQVRARWSAEFNVDGLGPFPIQEAVAQDAERPVRVGEGRAVLAVR